MYYYNTRSIFYCAKIYIFNQKKCWGRGLWAWSDCPFFFSLADHVSDNMHWQKKN